MNFEELSRTQIETLIEEWVVGRNAERNRSLIRRRLVDGILFENLAEEFDLSVTQAKNIVYKGMKRILKSPFLK